MIGHIHSLHGPRQADESDASGGRRLAMAEDAAAGSAWCRHRRASWESGMQVSNWVVGYFKAKFMAVAQKVVPAINGTLVRGSIQTKPLVCPS